MRILCSWAFFSCQFTFESLTLNWIFKNPEEETKYGCFNSYKVALNVWKF